MARQLLISTGVLVGRENGFDYRGALSVIRGLCEASLADGLELMMLKFYYDRSAEVAQAVRESGIVPYTIHCEKEVGTLISNAAVLSAQGKNTEANAAYAEAVRLFRLNCGMAYSLSIPRMVLHLWGGYASDGNIDSNISKFGELRECAAEYGVRVLVENVPSNTHDPLSNWEKLLPHLSDGGLIFDTRFGKLHEQTEDIFARREMTRRIEHIHISDFGGEYRDFSALRPILHPGEGKIDFSRVAALLDAVGYDGTVTLESPVMEGAELNIKKLERTLSYLAKLFNIK